MLTKKALIFGRPFTKEFDRIYQQQGLSHGIKYFSISDFRRLNLKNNFNLIDNQYRLIKSNNVKNYDFLPSDIISRCRYLKGINKSTAYLLINSFYQSLENIDASEIDHIISLPVDNYCSHLVFLWAKHNSIKIITPQRSFAGEYTRITSMGEYIKVRDPEIDEIESLQKKLNGDFAPYTLNKPRGKFKIFLMYLRERVKKIIFEALKILKNEKYSFHYNTIFPHPFALTIYNKDSINAESLFLDINKSMSIIENEEFCWLVLQFSPETSLDYHIEDTRFSDYEKLITEINKRFKDLKIVAKEHPTSVGIRHPHFYKFLKSLNIDLIHHTISANDLIKNSKFIITTGGSSSGAEALSRNQKVINLGGAYYIENPKSLEIGSLDKNLDELFVDQSPYETCKRILENTIPGRYDFFSRSKNSISENDRKIVNEIIKFITSL